MKFFFNLSFEIRRVTKLLMVNKKLFCNLSFKNKGNGTPCHGSNPKTFHKLFYRRWSGVAMQVLILLIHLDSTVLLEKER